MKSVSLNVDELAELGQRIQTLQKSFSAAGYPGTEASGRTGVAALAREHLDTVMRSIAIEDDKFMIIKDIPTIKAEQSVYHYKLKTAVGVGLDLAGTETFLPQLTAGSYMRVHEVLKIYGVRQVLSHMTELIGEAGGYDLNPATENDHNATMALSEQMERTIYEGGDLYMDLLGNIDGKIASDINGPIRQVRGIQANIREGDKSLRGIPGDFIGFNNNRSVVFDAKGSVLSRKRLNRITTAVHDNGIGRIAEAHCTSAQADAFRETFFPTERSNINDIYAINGPDVSADRDVGFSVNTSVGVVKFRPNLFKYRKVTPEITAGMQGSGAGAPPATPGALTTAAGGSVIGKGSGFAEGDKFYYKVQAVSVAGLSGASTSAIHTVGAGDDDKPIEVTWAAVTGAEYYRVYRTTQESDAVDSDGARFVGNVLATPGTLKFVDNDKIKPGLNTVLFLPKEKDRAKLCVLGNLLHKMELGRQGLSTETVYVSYYGVVVDSPRSFALLDNVYEDLEGVDEDDDF